MVSGPSGNDFQDLCTMIGLMTIQWAWAENALAIAIGTIQEQCGPIKGYNQAPLSLDRRIDCLKTALRDNPELKSVKDGGRLMAIRFKELGTRRHDFVHGSAWQTQNSSFQSIAIKVKAGNSFIHDHSFNQSDAVALNAEITKLVDEAMVFLIDLQSIIGL